MTSTPKLLVVGQLPPPHHGSNVMTKMFFSSLRKFGCKVSIAEKTFSKTMEEMGSYTLKRFIRAQVVIIRLVKIFVTTRPDLCFYFISLRPPSVYIDMMLLLLLRIINTKTVLYIHGKGFQRLLKRSPLMMNLFLESPIISSLQGALVLCEKIKKDVEFFIPNDRLFVLQNCIPDVEPQILKAYCEKRKTDKISILYLSNLFPAKGTIEFLKMARMVVDSGKPVRFILAGAATSASFHQKIKQMISDLKLKDDVETVGAVYDSAKERLFHESDIFVFPTQNDAFPLVNIEAMRAGLPIVSSNEGCIPEMVIDGFNGYIVKPHDIEQLSDRVLKLINDDKLRIKMGKAGRKLYEKYFTTQAYEKKLQNGVNFFLGLAGLKVS